jgi:carboxyl-terminal processing protease
VDWRAAAVTFGPKAVAAADQTALYRAVNGMLGLLGDGHTGAFTPAEARDYHTQEKAMTGFRLLRVDGRWAVSEVLPGSPAEDAGVKPGWIVLSRDGQTLGDVLKLPLLRGGEVVRWEFLDGRDQPVALALAARRVSIARRDVRVLPGGIVCLRFDEFDWTTMRWFSRQLKLHRDAPGVVVDLRQNSGGTLLALDFMVGEFFDRGFTYAVSVDRSGNRRNLNALMLGSAHYRGRLAVLVDRLSVSAAEILAATMQEQRRGTIIGRKTAGDVLGARLSSLADGGMLEYSDRDVRTLQDKRLDGSGVAPDVEAPKPTLAELRAGRDPDIEAALRVMQQP